MKFYRTRRFWIGSAAACAAGAVLAALDGRGSWFLSWLLYSLLLGLGLASLSWASKSFQADHKASRTAFVAWVMRVSVGVALMLLLPLVGNKNGPSQAGYLYDDAFRRDSQAWELAASQQPLVKAFSGDYSGDQYGGVLALYALMYRYLSPDAHRPFLVILLGAVVSIWGVLAAWAAAREWFGLETAGVAAWVMALYPEALFLSASHMREALLIPASALAWYSLIPLQRAPRIGWAAIVCALLALLLVQPAAAVGMIVVIAVFWMLQAGRRFSWRGVILWGFFLLAAVIIVLSVWANLPSLQKSGGLGLVINWLSSNFNVQISQTERQSGWMQTILGDIGQQFKGAAVTVYGLFRPVLPAALIVPGVWIMQLIEILRACGWYMLAPLLAYAAWLVFRPTRAGFSQFERRAQLRWLALAVWGWALLASMNAGGDQWDNPRYRAMFLVFQALLSAWAWCKVRALHERWFWRFAGVEAVFVVLFTLWYMGRTFQWFFGFHIYLALAVIAVASMAIIISGILYDRKHPASR